MEAAARDACPASAGPTEEMQLLPGKLPEAEREGEVPLLYPSSLPLSSNREGFPLAEPT